MSDEESQEYTIQDVVGLIGDLKTTVDSINSRVSDLERPQENVSDNRRQTTNNTGNAGDGARIAHQSGWVRQYTT